ncbi:uncharacterized protein LOC136081512 [Hydra vulgaris]|uniref:Uncharacterized protein LOC136081512 n=1 Tax=Hydra vulgaris TaxID=6087 RepID=A0ABM4C068_HYDVU
MVRLHKSGCQKRKERQKHIMNEKKVCVRSLKLEFFVGEKIETFEDNEDDLNGIETVSLSAFNCGQVLLDIGNVLSEIPSQSEIEKYVTNDHVDFPNILPKDINNQAFPQTILNFTNVNGEFHKRVWLVWSQHKQALFCFPCRLFSGNISKSSVTERNLSS